MLPNTLEQILELTKPSKSFFTFVLPTIYKTNLPIICILYPINPSWVRYSGPCPDICWAVLLGTRYHRQYNGTQQDSKEVLLKPVDRYFTFKSCLCKFTIMQQTTICKWVTQPWIMYHYNHTIVDNQGFPSISCKGPYDLTGPLLACTCGTNTGVRHNRHKIMHAAE